ncbi:uncharacterized protein IWZ02DRAFT_135261 [Phyllosticta citriasiana]|uniref:C2H2-type domain-containing protein n=1 Tax=Phyllosticta citriasiana TaxID=595635 RepID=A0ABR1KUE1_9PEZI
MASTGAFTPSTHAGPFPSARAAPDTPTSVSPVDPPLGGANSFKPHAAPNPTITLDPSLPSPTTSTRTPKSPAFKTTPAFSPQPLTGAAAMADDRRLREERKREPVNQTSPNPAISALTNLLGDNGMSKPRDAPAAATTLSEPLAKAAKNISIPDSVAGGQNMQTSPTSVSSFDSLDSTTAPTATANATVTAPPGQFGPGGMPVTDGSHDSGAAANTGPQPGEGFANNRSQTFPVPAPPDHDPRQPTRVLSMPMAGYSQNNSPRSPSTTTKRHKCPYCSTDFTRHHNLKSHLLTHSQEKPYECPTCQARFRRLHDLKRHTKLHTGERPHTCPKCGRKFARGDALARHNKGQGGCAGRRSSFGVDEDGEGKNEEGMDGLVYHGDGGDDERMDEDDPSPRRVSEPSSKGRSGSHSSYQQHSSTYPPVQGRPAGNNVRPMYPPSSTGAPTSRDPSGHPSPKTIGTSLSSVHYGGQQQAPPVFQGGMTESPKPISPGQIEAQRHQGILEGAMPGGRSPNMPQQAHQQYQQRGVGRGSSPMSLPPPVGTSHAPGPHLPSLPGLSNDMRMAVNKMGAGHQKAGSQSGQPGPSMLHNQMSASGGSSSNQGSLSSHGPSSGASLREYFGGREPDLWEYIRNLEQRMVRGQDEANARILALQDEVAQLRAQLPPQLPPQQQGR